MKQHLRIAMIAAECVPYAKTGGLADVVGALPPVLRAMGHAVIVVMPKHGSIDAQRYGLRPVLSPLRVPMGGAEQCCAVDTAVSDGAPVCFAVCKKYFARAGLYHGAEFDDYADNPRRFGFLARAGLQLCRDIGFAPDIGHAH